MSESQANIFALLGKQCRLTPHLPAIIDARNSRYRLCTFLDLELSAINTSRLLEGHGLKKGDCVLVLCPMSIELYIILLAAFRLGLVAMFLDSGARTEEAIKACCSVKPPAAVIASGRAILFQFLIPSLRKIPLKFSLGAHIPGTIPLPAPNKSKMPAPSLLSGSPVTALGKDDLALLTFTSGTTAVPKAIGRSHGFLMAQHAALKESLRLEQGQIHLTALPIFVLANLASGVTSIIPEGDLAHPGLISAAPVLKQIQNFQPTEAVASPAFLEQLVEYSEKHKLTLNNFARIFTGGAPVFRCLTARLQAICPQAEIVSVYGSSEAEPIAQAIVSEAKQPSGARTNNHDLPGRAKRPDLIPEKAGLLAGRPEPFLNLRIIRSLPGESIGSLTAEQFASRCLPESEIGEIVVTGAHVVAGYLNGAGDKTTKFSVTGWPGALESADGGQPWHRTGDAGYLDEQGRLWLVGQCQAVIRDRLGCLYPLPLESAIASLPGVKRAAVVLNEGRRTLAIEAASPNIQVDLSAAQELLAKSQIAEIRILKKIPTDKRHNSKVNYSALQKLLRKNRVGNPFGFPALLNQSR